MSSVCANLPGAELEMINRKLTRNDSTLLSMLMLHAMQKLCPFCHVFPCRLDGDAGLDIHLEQITPVMTHTCP